MKNKSDVLISFCVYAIGHLSLLLVDIFISRNFDPTKIADWAFYKSIIIILGSLTLLGYDQVLLRDPRLIKDHFKKYIKGAILIALLASFIIPGIKEYSFLNGLLIFLGIILFGMTHYITASSRANFLLWQSQFSKNFWKIVIFILVVFQLFENPFLYFVIALFIAIITSYFIKGFVASKENEEIFETISSQKAKGLAYSFLLTNLTLVLAIYGEQFIINLNGDIIASSHLFSYVAVFTPIAMSLTGFLGFYLSPKIIREDHITYTSFKKLFLKIVLFSFLVTLISSFSGYVFFIFFFDKAPYEVDAILIIILSLICFVRGMYIATSACLGIYGDKKIISTVAYYFWSYTILYLIGIGVVLIFFSGILAAKIISLISLFNWISRFSTSQIYTIRILKRKAIV